MNTHNKSRKDKKVTLSDLLKRLRKNKAFEKLWASPDTEEFYQIRKMAGLSQKEVAKKVGTKQESISRLENKTDSATLKFIGKVAYALGYKVVLKFIKL